MRRWFSAKRGVRKPSEGAINKRTGEADGGR